jgi:predicted nucleic acid-binding protein
MRVIIDTHLFIYREYENTLPKDLQQLLVVFNKFGVQIFAHPLSLQEIEQDANLKNPQVILSKLKIYPVIAEPPDANNDDNFLNIVGLPENPHDDADNQLLYCIYKKTADLLISEDHEILDKSQKIGISNKVLSVGEALEHFKKHDEAITANATHAGGPTYCFFRMGDYWEIGKPYKSKKLKNSKGLEFIHFLLKHPNKQLSPVIVYNLDKTSLMYSDHIDKDTGIRNLDPHELKERSTQLKQYQKIMADKDFEGPEDATWFEKEIRRLKMEIKTRVERDSKSTHSKARLNVYRGIDRALKYIYKYMPDMASYLNNTTIKTGDKICYSPIENNQPHWVLREEDLPTEITTE